MSMRSFAACAIAFALLTGTPAFAHDEPRPRHGGTVQLVNDVAYELVARDDGAAIYVVDHGKPMPTAGMRGKLTVMVGAQKSEADLVAAGERLQAQGIKLAKGAKAVAVLSLPDKKTVTVRFAVK